MRFNLGHVITIPALLLAGLSAYGAEAATTGVGPAGPEKPLGTLWYPGPYKPSSPAAAPGPVPAVTPPAPAVRIPAPVKIPVLPAVTAPRQGKPLGTLWYPGPYDPSGKAPAPQPTPVVEPSPAPLVPRRPLSKPLGRLWYPGPYVSPGKVTTGDRPAPAPAAGPGIRAKTLPSPATAPLRAAEPASQKPAATGQSGKFDSDLPIHLSADGMRFDEKTGIVTATGNVEIISGQRKLLADTVVYNQNTDVVSASGNVHLTESGGEQIFGDKMVVSGDLKDAFIESIGIILTDKSRIAATSARRSAGVITEMRKGVYSPCNLCPDYPERPPLWQVKAVKIIHDNTTRTIEYRDAWLEVFGVPVAYTPYFSHPDPTVKRMSGLLTPTFGGSSDLGFVGRVPYFFNLSPYNDATLTALVTGEEGSGAIGEYRHRFQNGILDLTASIVGGDSEDDVRGHIESEGRFDIDQTWRWGFDFNRTTDDTYMRRYGFGSPNSLKSNLFFEGFRKRNYFAANGYAFQGLRAADDPGLEPLVLPLVEYSHIGKPGPLGGQTVLELNLLSLTREDGADTQRLSVRPGWQLPFTGPLGDVYKLSLAVNGDFYYADDLAREGKTNFSGASGRFVPQAMLDWRFPFVKEGKSVSQVIEPVMVAVYSPYGGNPDDIPNEDSTELEFDDTNLFSANKFSGIDRVEGGPRFNYGLKWGFYGKQGRSTSFFLGQSWRPKSDDTFVTGSGLEEDFSDLVGRVQISPGPHLDLIYRTRFASDNFSPKRNELTFNAGVPALSVNANYVFIEAQEGSEFPKREEINYSASSWLNRFWRVNVSGVTDLAAGETRRVGADLIYENECVIFTTRASRTFFKDRDLEPTDQVTFNVVLKTLGKIRTDVFQN